MRLGRCGQSAPLLVVRQRRVAPKTQADYLKTYEAYQKLWDRLDADTAAKVKSRNFERIFDAARVKVRAWEAKRLQR